MVETPTTFAEVAAFIGEFEERRLPKASGQVTVFTHGES